MLSRSTLQRIMLLVFISLVGFSIFKAVTVRSTMGILLALVSMCAGIHFLYILAKANREMKQAGDQQQ